MYLYVHLGFYHAVAGHHLHSGLTILLNLRYLRKYSDKSLIVLCGEENCSVSFQLGAINNWEIAHVASLLQFSGSMGF